MPKRAGLLDVLQGFVGTEGKCVNNGSAPSVLVRKLEPARVSPWRETRARDGVYFAHAGLLEKIKTGFKKKEKKRRTGWVFTYSCPHVTVTDLKVRFSMNAKSFPFFFFWLLFFYFYIFFPSNQWLTFLRYYQTKINNRKSFTNRKIWVLSSFSWLNLRVK